MVKLLYNTTCTLILNYLKNIYLTLRIASMGHTVIGIEFVEDAIKQFFQEQNIKYTTTKVDDFIVYTVSFK